jgi:hypothetical protein
MIQVADDEESGGSIHAAFDSAFEIVDDTLRQDLVCPRVFKGRHVDPHLAAESDNMRYRFTASVVLAPRRPAIQGLWFAGSLPGHSTSRNHG